MSNKEVPNFSEPPTSPDVLRTTRILLTNVPKEGKVDHRQIKAAMNVAAELQMAKEEKKKN